MYIIIAILMFGLLIGIHELGHFLAAKCCGVRVNEFAIGMGPALWKKQKGETLYAVRLLPIGGYCAMEAENEESDDPRAFTNQSFWERLVILCAGSFMNLLIGVVFVFLLFAGAKAFVTPTVESFMDGCPYTGEEAFLEGDTFYKINGDRVYLSSDISQLLGSGGDFDITVLRNGEKVSFHIDGLQPIEYEGCDTLKFGFIFATEEATLGAKLRMTWNNSLEFSRWVWMGVKMLVSGQVGIKDMAGPVGIVDMMNDVGEASENTRDGLYNMLYYAGFIAINLAIMNMLPIPALDGGRVFLMTVTVIIEAITRRKLNPKYENYIHVVGMALLLLLMAVIMYVDISRIVGG